MLRVNLPVKARRLRNESGIQEMSELKGFRDVARHAYDLVLKPDRLAELARIAENISAELTAWCAQFGRTVRTEQGWGLSFEDIRLGPRKRQKTFLRRAEPRLPGLA